jgi:hypothetical protein
VYQTRTSAVDFFMKPSIQRYGGGSRPPRIRDLPKESACLPQFGGEELGMITCRGQQNLELDAE